jgi:hypothetical protein
MGAPVSSSHSPSIRLSKNKTELLIGPPFVRRRGFEGLQEPVKAGDADSRSGLAFPGNALIEETIWQPTEVKDGEVDDC